MKTRTWFFLAFAVSAAVLAGAAPVNKVEPIKEAPKGLSEKVAAIVGDQGTRVVGAKGPVAEIWFVKAAEVKAGFKPTLNVKYPFTPGELIGALRVPDGAKLSDFRGQQLDAGEYTLRYGQQPMDGNHVGTSELSDFILAVPAKDDTDPAPIKTPEQLHSKSAQASGSTHPAIFSLPPPKDAAETPALEHDAASDFWILNASLPAKADGKPVPLRLVVIGQSAL
jgi:hypothetical protein